MRNRVFLVIVASLVINKISAQYKEYNKLSELYISLQYEKCIEQSIKANSKEPSELMPVLYCSKSYFEIFKKAEEKQKLTNIKNSLKYAAKIKSIDKKEQATDKYSDFLKELHTAALTFGDSVFQTADKEKSKPIFESIAKIYKDTTVQYLTFHPEDVKKSATVGINTVVEKKNQTDKNGLKQGFWSKVYPSGILAYEINFKDDKPVGKMKRYHENGKLMAELEYDQNGEWADARHYDENGQLIAEGKYHNKLRSGVWNYYAENKKVSEDKYVEGKKNGISKTFYKSGQISEEKNWENDIENGVWRQYYPTGKLKLETRIDKGVRNSVYYTYYENGRFEVKGHYKQDAMDGEWIYYDESGKEMEKINYVMGKTDKQKELDEKENEFFKKIDQNKSRLVDPADFINNPNEYLQKSGLK